MAREKAKEVRWPGSGSILDGIPPGWQTTLSASKLCERSKDTLRRWRADGTFSPSGYMVAGKLTIPLYSDQDIEELILIAGTKKAGRPPQEEGTDEGSSRAADM